LSAPALRPLAPSIPAPSLAPAARGFAALDERVLSTREGGAVLVARVIDPTTVSAVLSHVARRAGTPGATVLRARGQRHAPLWREIAQRLSITKLDCAPLACAMQIASAALAKRAVIVAPLPTAGSWDRAVAAEIAQLDAMPLVVFVADHGDEAEDLQAETYEIAPQLDASDRERWLEGARLDAARTLPYDDLTSLEAWWTAARAATPRATTPVVPSAAAPIATALTLAGRSLPVSTLVPLGDLDALVAAGVATVERGLVTLDHEVSAPAADATMGAHVALSLVDAFGDDPWALARAAELFLVAGDTKRADETYGEALRRADESLARREIAECWMTAVDAAPADVQLVLARSGAERALAAGEADEAYRWAKRASAGEGGHLLLGRAAIAMGDLVAAKVALERGRDALATKGDEDERARIVAELAEVAYLAGDHDAAASEAAEALTAKNPRTRLRARNTLGKLLLAASRWDEAERHFTEDAAAASAAGARTDELRAHVNRGIAVLSRGKIEEAQSVFEMVLEEGERLRDARAAAFALDNLAVTAMWRHEYGLALELYERTLKLRLRLGHRLTTALNIANVAELRAKLGLLAHAEHGVAFGRRLLGPGMPPRRAAHFAVVAARVALARGRTSDAQREVSHVIAAHGSPDCTDYVGEAYRVAARIALDDGDVPRALAAVSAARQLASKDPAHAEVAVLSAACARAEGTLTDAMLDHALKLARTAGEEETLIEAHLLAYDHFQAEAQLERARAHAQQALALRDAVAATLRGEVRTSYLARAGSARLDALVAELGSGEVVLLAEGSGDEASPSTQRSPRGASYVREIVGDDPAIRGLLAAIKKVGKSDGTVLIRGESGTGKELVAEGLHRASERANGPFVAVNCAALVETLLLSELFGHEKGAFTGAAARRRGRFELAEGGTLFLDEIGDISPRTQVALLRVLQERTFERVGGTTAIRANCRIICATHRDLKAMVERGEFREDLYYRLRGITLEVPALRNRLGDLPRIAENLLGRIAAERGEAMKSLHVDAIELLQRHRWSGNVRELENALRAASLFAEGAMITAQDLTENVEDLRNLASTPIERTSRPSVVPLRSAESGRLSEVEITIDDAEGSDEEAPLPPGEAGPTAVAYACVRQGAISLSDLKRQIERDCIARALAETRGNITKAANLLGMKRPRLSQLVKQYGLAVVSSES
jgi:transcriptional regulator with GAF, ATPase, and Fis domain/tetratricopeptide (TPR) repeat protein